MSSGFDLSAIVVSQGGSGQYVPIEEVRFPSEYQEKIHNLHIKAITSDY